MKSLEIVNDFVDYWEAQVNKACRSNAENGYYDELDIAYFQDRLKEYKTIKQDLDVLEIIKKKKVEVFALWFDIKTLEEQGDMYILISYNGRFHNKLYELTMEELLKLKQWLEENENAQI